MLVYFGYSFCPDVCPTDLQKITIALDILEEKNIDISLIQPIFITIDLERDSQDIIAEFVSNFHSSLIGLTGTQAQIKKAASAYRVYYQKAGNSEDEYYLMDHSSLVYVMGANGLYLSHFSSLDSPKGIAERLVGYLKDLN
jgi:protein SCO1/2